MVVESIWEGVASNFIFLVIVALLGWIAYLLVRRRPLVRFFDLRRTRRLVIYTSTLQVPRFTSSGVDGQTYSFGGPAIPAYEATTAAALQRLFHSAAPGVSGISGWLRHLRFVDLDVVVETSPPTPDDVTRTETFIAVGSPAYNAASVKVQTDFRGKGRFRQDTGTMEVAGKDYHGDVCLLERVTDPARGQTAFYAAGHSVAGTAGAVNHLRANWRSLVKRYKGDFCLLLQVNADGSNQEVIFETASYLPSPPPTAG
jgi:hypothetical protein